MKLLVVGHTYITAFAQTKYVAMKALRSDLSLRIVVPPSVRHSFGVYRPELADGLTRAEVVAIRSFGGNTNMTYVLDPVALGSLMRQFAPTHVHIEEDPHSMVGSVTAWLAARMCPEAVVSYFIWDNLNRKPRFPAGAIKRWLTRRSLAKARLVVCGNAQAKSLLLMKGYHGASEVIPQLGLYAQAATSGSEMASRLQARSLTPSVPMIGYFGRLVEEKGVLDLCEALNQLCDLSWKFVIYGDGPLRQELEARWRPVFGDRFDCFDAIPHLQVEKKLRLLDIFVLPSYSIETWKEQFGLTLAQAMLAGCACIGSSCGAIPEVLGGAGVVFPERNVGGLVAALRRLLESPDERARLSAAARDLALARYTSEAVAGRYLSAFESITEQMALRRSS